MDEKWSFVAKKEKNCDEDDPEDQFRGDCWDHVAFDPPEHRLVVSVVPGERTGESVRELVTDVKERLGGRAPELITTDEYTAYEGAILEAFGTEVVPPRTGKPGRPRKPSKVAPAGLHYATVHKTRKKGRVVDVVTRVIFGTAAAVEAALVKSGVSHRINTAFVERHNGTDRNRNSRKVRKTYCFSKDWWVHRAVTFFTMYSYNFCWPVRTLKTESGEDRTPAMMAKLTDHVWTLAEWIKRPAVQLYSVRRGMRRFHESRIVLQLSRKKQGVIPGLTHQFFLRFWGVIPKCGHAALRLDCFLVDVCVTSSSSSSSSFNSARHSGGVQRQSVRRSLAIASRVCSTISSQRPDTTAARSWNTASALSSVQ